MFSGSALGSQMRYESLESDETVMANATAVIELARQMDSPHSTAFLQAYHRAEADIAAADPWLSEAVIRGKAVIQAFHFVGLPWL